MKFSFLLYLYYSNGYGTRGRAYSGTGRLEYTGHVKYYHVYAAHLLEKHTPNAD